MIHPRRVATKANNISAVTAYLISRGPKGDHQAPGDHLVIGGNFGWIDGSDPVALNQDRVFARFRAGPINEGHFTDNTLSVHLYTNGTRPWWRKNPPMPGSYAAADV